MLSMLLHMHRHGIIKIFPRVTTAFFIDVTKTGTSGSHSPPVPQSFPTKPGSMGLDTMNELADKEKFFHDVEEEMSAVDYKKKLAEISTSDSVTMDRYINNVVFA